MTDGSQKESPPGSGENVDSAVGAGQSSKDDFTDGRGRWDWKRKYPEEAVAEICFEAKFLASVFAFFVVSGGLAFGLSSKPLSIIFCDLVFNIDWRLLIIFLCGGIGGTTFSIKWLFHAVAKGTWHLDRRLWRFFVPFLGGVYACVVLAFFEGGFIGGSGESRSKSLEIVAAISFVTGYFSDGVGGLLSNLANVVFGTVKK